MTEHRTQVSRYEQLMAAGRPQMLATSNVWGVDAAVCRVMWCYHHHNNYYHFWRLHQDSIFIRLPAINWQFCHIDGSHMVVGRSLSPVCRRGTYCRNVNTEASVFGRLLKTFRLGVAFSFLNSVASLLISRATREKSAFYFSDSLCSDSDAILLHDCFVKKEEE